MRSLVLGSHHGLFEPEIRSLKDIARRRDVTALFLAAFTHWFRSSDFRLLSGFEDSDFGIGVAILCSARRSLDMLGLVENLDSIVSL